ncbi:MAG: endonuclease domain-containing protein [Hyphomicrobiales bacterium]
MMRGRDRYQLPIARKLRRDETSAEKQLREQLRGRKLNNLKFVRQTPIGPYVADFLCRERKLVIELDGATHSTPEEIESDKRRTSFQTRSGYRVIRFDNIAVFEGIDGVLQS